MRLLIDPTDWSQTVIFDEIFLRSSYDLRRVEFAPHLIIDCGGHIGLFSLLSKSVLPDAPTIVFEPDPRNAQFIRKQILRNRLEITLVESAVSTRGGLAEFQPINSHGGRLRSEADGDCFRRSDTIPPLLVKTVALADFIQKMRPASLLLKMDIEGEERNVLPAIISVLPKKTALFFETHAGESGWRDIAKLLSCHGFVVEQINARGLYCDGFASRIEQLPNSDFN
jgi:FkbM family methyltransferase